MMTIVASHLHFVSYHSTTFNDRLQAFLLSNLAFYVESEGRQC